MTNALPLRPGDRAAGLQRWPGLDGKLRKFIWSFTGQPVVRWSRSTISGTSTCEQFAAFAARAKGRRRRWSWSPAARAAPPRAASAAKLGGDADGRLLLVRSASAKFVPPCSPKAASSLRPGGLGLRLRVIVLDPNQRVAATFDSRALLAAAEADRRRSADRVRSNGGAGQVIAAPMAPVLVLPRVFEREFCAQVIRLWERATTKDSGVSSRYGNVGMTRAQAHRGLHGASSR